MQIRLDSFLSKYGVCSRRRAKDLIEAGSVKVNQVVVTNVQKLDSESDEVVVDGKAVNPKGQKFRYIAFNKPLNVLSTTKDEWGRKTVLDFVKVPERVYPVGRLDYNSTGLLLLTNDGDFALKLTHPRYHLPKKYLVETKQEIAESQLDEMRKGVKIYDQITLPAKVGKIDNTKFEITLIQGLKRQVREMCKAVGLDVISLQRTHIGNMALADLKLGEYRDLTEEEINNLLGTA